MRTQQILSNIVKEFPEYEILKPVFVVKKEFDLILSGYALDRTPSTIYINKFSYPLYDHNGSLHLGYSKRLDKNFISLNDDIKTQLGKRVTQEIKLDKHKTKDINSVLDFCLMLENRYKGKSVWNSGVRMHYGMSQILLGNYELANQALEKSREHIHSSKIQTLETVISKLNNSPEEAKAFILEQAEKMKAQLKLK